MIYSGSSEEGSSHTGQYASIKNSKGSYVSEYSSTSSKTRQKYLYGSTYVGYMYNPELVLTTTPYFELTSTNNLSKYPYYSKFDTTKYYFFDNFDLNSNCSIEDDTCTMICTNYNSKTGIGDNCVYSTWYDLASNENNYNPSGIGATSSLYNYTNKNKYTCANLLTITSINGTTVTIKCPIVSEILGVVKNGSNISETTARVRYHGLFSESAESSSTNVLDSNIKYEVDYWYKNNILNQYDEEGNLLSNYLSDEIFCNDRSFTNGNGYNFDLGSVNTSYGAHYRNVYNKSPSLVCRNDNDKFTVSANNGNGALRYPIALITLDEVALAGSKNGIMNYNYYLWTNQTYWTMSPSVFYSSYLYSTLWYVRYTGALSTAVPSGTYGIRPVLNLSSKVLYSSGSGTEEDPYKVVLS